MADVREYTNPWTGFSAFLCGLHFKIRKYESYIDQGKWADGRGECKVCGRVNKIPLKRR